MSLHIRRGVNKEMHQLLRQDLANSEAFEQLLVRLHGLIARTYGRLFLASADPLAAFLTVQHALRSAQEYLPALRRASQSGKFGNHSTIAAFVVQALRHAETVLHTGRRYLSRRVVEQATEDYLDVYQRETEKLQGVSKRLLGNWPGVSKINDAVSRLGEQVFATRCEALLTTGRYKKLIAEFSEHADRADNSFSISVASAYFLGTAFLCLRQYRRARQVMETELLKLFGRPLNFDTEIQAEAEARTQLFDGPLSTIQDKRGIRDALKLLRRYIYLDMHESQAAYMGNGDRVNDMHGRPLQPREVRFEARKAQLLRARKLCCFGLELLRSKPFDDDLFVYYENARLRAHFALIEGLLGSLEADPNVKKDLFQRAVKILVDARAFVEEFPIAGDTLSMAVLDLRLAEIQLLQASTETARSTEATSTTERGIELAADSIHTLGRAERLLREHRKNVWWWNLYLILRAKAHEHSLRADLRVLQNQCTYELPARTRQRLLACQDFFSGLFSELPPRAKTDPFVEARILECCLNIVETVDRFKAPEDEAGETDVEHIIRAIRDDIVTSEPKLLDKLKERIQGMLKIKDLDPAIKKYAGYVCSLPLPEK